MRLLIIMLLPVLCSAKTVELGFPELKHRVKVVLPEGHDPAKKYPAILYYHGADGEPSTSFISRHTGSQKWIVVGMSYFQVGKFTMSREAMAREMTLLRSVKRHLQAKYGMDPARCYVAGYSKGGWMVDMFLQADPSLAGGVILGAGHLHTYHKSPVKYRKRKPVFIGVGRLDGNYPFALRAVLHHRKMGGRVTMEEWRGVGHTLPESGSEGLTQWLSLRYVGKDADPTMMGKVVAGLVESAKELEPLEQWYELRRIKALPYTRGAGDARNKEIDALIKELEKKPQVSGEARAFGMHRKLMYQEITERSLEKLMRVSDGYAKLLAAFPNTKQVKLAERDRERVAKQIEFIRENKKAFPDDGNREAEPEFPENRRRIPRNPLVR